jgi:PAS domain S-box-containing protein
MTRVEHSGKTTKPRYDDLWTHLTTGEVWKGEYINQRKDGSGCVESVLISPMSQDDERVSNYLAIKEGITERNRISEILLVNENRLKEAQRIGKLGFFDWDLINNEIELSDETLQMYGLDPAKKVVGAEEIVSLVHPDDAGFAVKSLNEAFEGRGKYDIEHRIVRPDGNVIYVHTSAEVFRDNNGQPIRVFGIALDITESKLAEVAVLQLNEELEGKVAARTADLENARLEAEQANRAKSSFLASMSHEIRTPMNGVIGMIDVLQQSGLKGSQVEMVNIIHDSAFALLAIIDDILDFSKIEAGKLYTEWVSMAIADVVEGTCETMDRLAFNKNVELTLFIEPAIPKIVMGDPGRLRQILVNLTNNAIKFSSGQIRPGRVSLRVIMVESTPEHVSLEFRVTDNGIGMDKQTQERLFIAFTQAESSTTRTYGGTGLGLTISRQLVKIMGGEISVLSELGKGSVFSVHISLALPLPPFPANGAPSLVAGLLCLVVGDSESLADDLAAYLVYGDAVVERVPDLVTARKWLMNQPPGLCIVVIDNGSSKLPLDELRAAASARPNLDVNLIVIERGYRRRCRSEASDLVILDGEVMHQRAFLEAVSVAAGRAKQPELENLLDNIKSILTPLSREEARRQGTLILVAEDNEVNQTVILQQLTLLGKTADIACNGRDALERWQSGDYGILLTDLHMPEMDGYELSAAIRSSENFVNETETSETRKPRIPIIAFTANALKGEAEHCRAVGMDDYLSKPVQLVNLKAMLEKWLPVNAESISVDPGPALTVSSDLPVTSPAHVDLNVLKALIGDEELQIRKCLHVFHLSTSRIAVELRTACAAGQTVAAGTLMHKLKSSARSVGALALGDLCAEIEQVGKAGNSAALAVLLPRFELELMGVEHFLEGY